MNNMRHGLIFMFFFLMPALLLATGKGNSNYGLTLATGDSRDSVVPQIFEYVKRGDKALKMYVYSPKEARVDSACVVYIFGGGFVMGSPIEKSARQLCQRFASDGYTAVAIDYRLHLAEINKDTVTLFNMQGVFRDAINMAAADASAAVAYICEHSEELGVSKERIVLSGSSAGAITALQLDYCRCNGLLPAASLPAGWAPAAVVSYAGGVFSDCGNPKYALEPAPTLFLHGDIDKIVNYKKFPPVLRKGLYGTKKLHRTFEKRGYPHWFFRFEGIGHEVATYHNYMYEEFKAFVDKALKHSRMHYDATIRDEALKPTKWSKMNVFDLYK